VAVGAFNDRSVVPNDDMVAAALADSNPLWEELQNHVHEFYPNITKEWKHYGKASGWTCKLISGKRNMLFFTPQNGCFRVRIVLGERAAARAGSADLPDDIKEAIRTAAPYVEGRGIDVDISRSEQLDAVKSLLRIKLEN